eukprot:Nk52_evm7s2630 gene=Nk52_evmTU7s2630
MAAKSLVMSPRMNSCKSSPKFISPKDLKECRRNNRSVSLCLKQKMGKTGGRKDAAALPVQGASPNTSLGSSLSKGAVKLKDLGLVKWSFCYKFEGKTADVIVQGKDCFVRFEDIRKELFRDLQWDTLGDFCDDICEGLLVTVDATGNNYLFTRKTRWPTSAGNTQYFMDLIQLFHLIRSVKDEALYSICLTSMRKLLKDSCSKLGSIERRYFDYFRVDKPKVIKRKASNPSKRPGVNPVQVIDVESIDLVSEDESSTGASKVKSGGSSGPKKDVKDTIYSESSDIESRVEALEVVKKEANGTCPGSVSKPRRLSKRRNDSSSYDNDPNESEEEVYSARKKSKRMQNANKMKTEVSKDALSDERVCEPYESSASIKTKGKGGRSSKKQLCFKGTSDTKELLKSVEISSKPVALNRDEGRGRVSNPNVEEKYTSAEIMTVSGKPLRSLKFRRGSTSSSTKGKSTTKSPQKDKKRAAAKEKLGVESDKEEGSSDEEDDDDGAEYEVEYIVDVRKRWGKKENEYLVKWVNWSKESNTWQTEDSLSCSKLLKEYHTKLNKDMKKSVQEKKCYYRNPDADFVVEDEVDVEWTENMLYEKTCVAAKQWEDCLKEELKLQNPDLPMLSVVNDINEKGAPDSFTFVSENVYGRLYEDDMLEPDDDFLIGCDCTENHDHCGPDTGCVAIHTLNPISRKPLFAYNKDKRLILEPGEAIYECNKKCKCGPKCPNRVMQLGPKTRLQIFMTEYKGWGVKNLERIEKGTFVCEYVGEIITNRMSEERGATYDSTGSTYLFDLDYEDIDKCKYTIDAYRYGNVSHFINHSCNPNLASWVCWYDSVNPNLPRIGLFAIRDILPGEELSFDYMMKGGADGYLCRCGEKNCRSYLQVENVTGAAGCADALSPVQDGSRKGKQMAKKKKKGTCRK